MLDNEGAGAGGNDGQGGSGAPSGGSPEGGSENDDKPITAKQLKAALASQRVHYEGRLESQRSEFEAFKAGASSKAAPAEQPKRHSRADLKAAVDGAQITQEQADELWARQIEADATEKAVAAATAAVAGGTQKERIGSDIESYKRLKPEIMEEGSEIRAKVKAEFDHLVRTGLPGSGEKVLATQLAAIRAVLGPLEKLERSSQAGRAQESEQQSGGGEGAPRGGSGTGKKLVDQLSARQKAHYQKGIDSRRYKDWGEVEAELKFSPRRIGRA